MKSHGEESLTAKPVTSERVTSERVNVKRVSVKRVSVEGASVEQPTAGAQIAAAARANLVPGLLLQAVALLLVLAYYFWPAARQAFLAVAEFKATIGYVYSFFALSLFAGILPLVLRRLQPNLAQDGFAVWPFYAVFWGIMGVFIDAFYNLQAWIFGQGTDALTIAIKVAVDMLLFSPCFALPLVCVCFVWKDQGFNVAKARVVLGPYWYQERVWPMVIAAWIVWIPAVALVYSLPLALQFPVQNVIECMWAMILLFLTRPEAPEFTHASS